MDEYPIVLVPGLRLAESAEQIRDIRGFKTTADLLNWVDDEYIRMMSKARPRPDEMAREFQGLVGSESPPGATVEIELQ